MKQLHNTVTLLRILYPTWAVVGMFSLMYVPSKIMAPGNAAATAQNIINQEFLFRSGIIGSLLTQLIFIFAALYLYKLFVQAGKEASLLMLVLALTSVPIAMLNEVNSVAAMLQTSNPEQMMFFLELNKHGVIIAAIFWGLWLFPLGYLIWKSGYFPKAVGVAVLLGGLGYTVGSVLKLLVPEQKTLIAPFEFMTFGEIVWMLWLAVRGVRFPEN